jgi:hypothetical protein
VTVKGSAILSATQRAELTRFGFSDDLIDSVNVIVYDAAARREAIDPSLRRRAAAINDIHLAMRKASQLLTQADGPTKYAIYANAYGTPDRAWGSRAKTLMKLSEFENAIAAFTSGASLAADTIRSQTTGTAPEPIFERHVALDLARLLRANQIKVDRTAKGTFSRTIAVAFEALGIKIKTTKKYAEWALDCLDDGNAQSTKTKNFT